LRRRECRIFVVLAMAFSIVFAGCREEADRVVRRPLNEIKGSVVGETKVVEKKGTALMEYHTHTPSPRPTPTPRILSDLEIEAGEDFETEQ
jgi:hypothetical protein